MGTTRKRTRRWDGGGQSGPTLVSAGKASGEARIGQALRGRVQAKLAVSRPGDASEREADHAAEAVMRGADARGIHPRPALIQRACATCAEEDDVVSRKAAPDSEEEKKRREEEKRAKAKHKEIEKEKNKKIGKDSDREEDELVHAKRESGGPDQAPATAEAGARALADGAPLPEHLRAFFEARFGRRFDGVRLHTDAAAGETARELGALAFAVRDQIAFAPGQFRPDTQEGRTLLAHELAHVVQQGYAPALDGAAETTAAAAPAPAATEGGTGSKD